MKHDATRSMTAHYVCQNCGLTFPMHYHDGQELEEWRPCPGCKIKLYGCFHAISGSAKLFNPSPDVVIEEKP